MRVPVKLKGSMNTTWYSPVHHWGFIFAQRAEDELMLDPMAGVENLLHVLCT